MTGAEETEKGHFQSRGTRNMTMMRTQASDDDDGDRKRSRKATQRSFTVNDRKQRKAALCNPRRVTWAIRKTSSGVPVERRGSFEHAAGSRTCMTRRRAGDYELDARRTIPQTKLSSDGERTVGNLESARSLLTRGKHFYGSGIFHQ